MTKPIGPLCNLNCDYCFYLKKTHLFDHKKKREFRMTDEVLELYIEEYITAQPKESEVITFAWQGGEPSLLGIEFFQRVIELQEKYKRPNLTIQNSFQTNGTLLTDEFCEFFKRNNFLIGISIDGPEELHNSYRKDKSGKGTLSRVMKGVKLLKKHQVEFNTMTVINSKNAPHPEKVYNFLKSIGSTFIQFIPIVERDGDNISDRSVTPEAFGSFMNGIFREWVKKDIGKIFVGHFDMLLALYCGYPSSACVHSKECGTAMAIEHTGDIYSCDHFVTPEYLLGNIIEDKLTDMVNGEKQVTFGKEKFSTLPEKCLKCDYLKLCYGACPKDRLSDGVNYLCDGFYTFYQFTEPYFMAMVTALNNRRSPNEFRNYLQFKERPNPGRNDICPCLSGKKFKNCCGRR